MRRPRRRPTSAARWPRRVADPRPSLVACRTVIGKGAPNKAGHHSGPRRRARRRRSRRRARVRSAGPPSRSWCPTTSSPTGARLGAARRAGSRRVAAAARKRFDTASEFDAPHGRRAAAPATRPARFRRAGSTSRQKVATRKASEMALEVADRAAARDDRRLGRPDRLEQHQDPGHHAAHRATTTRGRYLYYGIREFGMAAAMNGMALHGGVIPYGGTFLIFSDYCRNAIRLSALQQIRVVYVLTHDSHRPRRGRPDPPAGRAGDEPAADPQPQRVPPGRRDRDRRVLGARAGRRRRRPRCSR